jgi:hypothetical protein
MRAFGLRRRLWRIRRNLPRAVAQPLSAVLPRFPAPAKPIMLIGCPRSGTSVLLRALLAGGELKSVQSEGHILWDAYHHPRDRNWESDGRSMEDVGRREREYIYAAVRLVVRGRQFVDKTPENCLRIPYLDALFPDATFVFLRRRAADNVNSLMEGWRARPRFVRHRLPEPLEGIAPLDGNLWSFVLVPGWRQLRAAPLEEICARQYVVCNETALADRQELAPERWIECAYEDLVASPLDTIGALYERLGLELTRTTARRVSGLLERPGPTALTAPAPGKWRKQNEAAIERILPLVAPVEGRLYGAQPLDSRA